MANLMVLSKRKYDVYYVGSTGVNEFISGFRISDILDGETEHELNYSLHELIDEILDLKVNETIDFKMRDDENSRGLITRKD